MEGTKPFGLCFDDGKGKAIKQIKKSFLSLKSQIVTLNENGTEMT